MAMSVMQEAGDGSQVPGCWSVCRRQTKFRGALPSDPQRSQQANDRRLPGQPTATVQHGSIEVGAYSAHTLCLEKRH